MITVSLMTRARARVNDSHVYACSLHQWFITQYGNSALMIAASDGHTEVVMELVKRRANLHLQNKVSATAVHSLNF